MSLPRKLWQCPECGRKFANRNQWHSCHTRTVASHFDGRPPILRTVFDALVNLVESNGPVIINPVKTRISFQVRMNFAAVSVRKDYLKCHVVLRRKLEHPRFEGIETIGGEYVHTFTLRTMDDVDDELASWLAEAYQVGAQDLP